MASASCPDDVLQASDGKTCFVRLARLLLCGGTTVMRGLFDFIIPPANLATVLSSPAVLTRLQTMKNKKLLTSPQWQKLFPPIGTCVQSTSFDITLLFKLLRENVICGLIPPSTGWDQLPNIGDISLPADLARIKYFRNAIAHGDEKMELTEQEFTDYWKEIKDALVRIVGQYSKSGSSTVTDWETAINKLLTDPLTENDEKNVEELKSWYLDERELKGMVEQLLKRGEGDRKDEREMKEMVQQLVQKGEASENVFTVRFASRIAAVGGWLGGNIYILNRLKDHPDLLVDYIKYGVIPNGIALVCMAFGSIKLTLRGETLDGLNELWRRYKTGQLKEDFEKVMVTGELKTLANGECIEMSVEINEEEFMQTRRYLEKLSPAKCDEREEDSVEFGDQDEIFNASSGKNNIRLVRLLLSVGTVIIRELFDSIYPPDDLATVLKTPLIEKKLENLRKQKILSERQWNVLFPISHMSTCGKSESFDITLLFKLIRELVILIPPVPECGYLPVDTDLSLPADLARIELYRNNVYANGYERMELTDDEFKDYWKQIRDALMRIVNHYSSCSADPASAVIPWQTAIDELIDVSITEEDEQRVEEELKSWYLQDVEHKQMNYTTKEKLRINTEEMASKIDQNKSPEVTLQCTFKLSQRAWVLGTAYIIVQYKDAPKKLVNNIKEALPLGMVVSTIVAGSIKIVLQSKTLLSMEHLLKRYKAGLLEKKLEKVFVTEDLKDLANGEEITFSVEMSQRDYTRATDYCQPLINSKRKSKIVELEDSLETGDQNENMEPNDLKELEVKRVTDKITETEAKKKVQMKTMNFEEQKLKKNAFCCSDKGVRRYILEHRKDELVEIEKQYSVKIEAGETEKEFLITGRQTEFTVVRKALDDLTSSVEKIEMKAEEPGLHKFFASGKGERLVKAVENEHQCVMETLENGSRKTKSVPSKDFQEESLDTGASIEKDDEVGATALVCSSEVLSPSNVSTEESEENDMAERVEKMSSSITSSHDQPVSCDVQRSEEPNLRRGGLRSSISKIMKAFGRQSRTTPTMFGKVSVQVVHGDLVEEQTDAIVNINSTHMNMQNAGALSKAVAAAAGPAVQSECSMLGQQTPGSVVVTGPGELKVRYIIHMIPGSSNTAVLESCIKKCLRCADEYKFQSLSMPAFGTGNIYNLPAKTSAEAIFQAIAHVCPDLKNLQEIRVVVFQKGMLSAFKQTQQRYGSRTSKQIITATFASRYADPQDPHQRVTQRNGNDLPTEWCPMPMDSNGKEKMVHLVELEQSSEEYRIVFNMFQSTGGRGQILKIERVQNPYLYQLYMMNKEKMDKDNGETNNERQLFHGTAGKNLNDINARGFNRSFCGENVGAKYGKGVYFATTASYSKWYSKPDANKNKYMYLARVLTGRYTKGQPDLKTPPETFDAVADKSGPKASIFVVFYDPQCYPEYLITFQ